MMPVMTASLPAGDLEGFVHRELAAGRGHDPLERRRGPSASSAMARVRSAVKFSCGPGPGMPTIAIAIGRPHPRLDECFGRAPRDLFVAGCDVGLVEHEEVEMAAWRATVARDFGGHRAERRFGIGPDGSSMCWKRTIGRGVPSSTISSSSGRRSRSGRPDASVTRTSKRTRSAPDRKTGCEGA